MNNTADKIIGKKTGEKTGKKIIVGMSGGVDSSTAAYLLKQSGYEPVGVTMLTRDDGYEMVEEAAGIAARIGIEHRVIDYRETFKKNVIDYFMGEYAAGRTPNPCVVCNRFVKWESLLETADLVGAELVATGHYAKFEKYEETGRFTLREASASGKDQTYALYNLTQYQLGRTVTPIADFTKSEVRAMAEKIGLDISNKPDSQEICFIPDGDYGEYIRANGGMEICPGNFVDEDGKILGEHRGIIHYTIGQRKGLGISLGRPVFVKRIDAVKNEVVLSDNEGLFEKEVIAENVNFLALETIDKELKAAAKIRYNHKPAPCTVSFTDGFLKIVFDEPQRAVTPGQAAVVYKDGFVLAGGIIL